MSIAQVLRSAGIAVVLTLGLVGCVPEPPAMQESPRPTTVEPPATTTAPANDSATFVSVIDGDTIETSAGTVRIIGIDTPERGECGHDEASAAIGRLLSVGDTVTLELPPGQNDQDRYGRLIRYVTTDAGVDLGLMQLEAGNALARYDSSDGYPAHPREAAYHAAQIASPGPGGSVITIACQSEHPRSIGPTEDGWWMQYPSCARLKRNEVGHPIGPFARDDPAQEEIYNWFAHGTGHRGDGDGDGLACE